MSSERSALFTLSGSRSAGLGRPPAGGSIETLFRRAPRVRISFAPPPILTETDNGPSRAPFFFWFQRGLVMVTALQRLS